MIAQITSRLTSLQTHGHRYLTKSKQASLSLDVSDAPHLLCK